MIEIKFLEDCEAADIFDKIGAEKLPGLRVYAAKEQGGALGCCGFAIDGKNGFIAFTSMEKENLSPIEDGLLRASLSYMFESGVTTAACSGHVPQIRLKALGFRQKDGVFTLDLTDSFLTRGCGCKKK